MEYFVGEEDVPQEEPRKPLGRPKGSKKKRMTKCEQQGFINDSIRIILDRHMSYSEYVLFCKDKGLSAPQANEYWLKVWALIKKKFEMEKDKLILKHLQKYWDIYDQARSTGDLSNARQALNDIVKLQGLAEPEKVHVTGTTIKLNFGETND
jgi:hypothetical protein